MLFQQGMDQQAYWKQIKSFVRKLVNESSVLSIENFIIPKPYSSENDIIAYHFDHSKGKIVKGMNIFNLMQSSVVGGQRATYLYPSILL